MTASAATAALALPPSTETFGQPECNTRLIAKLRALQHTDASYLAELLKDGHR